MTQPSFRQIKVMVDNELLSHLSHDALESAAARASAAQGGNAEAQFVGENYSADDLQAVCKALDEEIELRGRSAA